MGWLDILMGTPKPKTTDAEGSIEAVNEVTAEEIATAHVFLEQKFLDLQGQYAGAYDTVIELQQQDLSGANPGKKLQDAKARMIDLDQKITAAQVGLEGLRSKLAEKVETDARRYIAEETPRVNAELQAEKKHLMNEFYVALAQAIVAEEAVYGPPAGFNDGIRIIPKDFELRFVKSELAWNTEARTLIGEEVVRARGLRTFGIPVEDRIHKASRRTIACERLLEDGGVDKEVERLLKAAGSHLFDKPEQPAPQPDVRVPDRRTW